MRELRLASAKRRQMIDITAELESLMADLLQKHRDGAILLFCSHTTAGLTVNENADPSVQRDFLLHFENLVPKAGFEGSAFCHGEGNSDAHIQSIVTGPSLCVPVSQGRLALGTWQGIYFCEFDGPRNRKLQCQFLLEAN